MLVIDIEDRPGEMGRLTRRFADAGVNVDFMYLATNTQAVLGVDDRETGRELQ